jgi:hypothetical protein
MRLEKHTDEEIKVAQEESGFSVPTEQDMKEWEQIHKMINMKHAELHEALGGATIINLDLVVRPLLTGKKAQCVARGRGFSTILELLYNPVSDTHFPWAGSGMAGYEYLTDEVFKGTDLEFIRRTVLCQFMCKLIEIDRGDTKKLEYWVKRFAATFEKLAESEKIKYGILAPFMALPLADLAAESAGDQALRVAQKAGAQLSSEKLDEITAMKNKMYDEAPTRRILLMVYPYSHLEREELNEWLGNEAFTEEGALGSDDWTNLPECP